MALAEVHVRPLPESDSSVRTIPQLFRTAAARGSKTALREKVRGIWRATSWREYGDRAMQVGLGLVALGLKRGESVAILASNSPEWVFCDIGIIGAGGVSVGVYETSASGQVAYLLNDSRARYIFVENEEQLDKVLAVRGECPDLRRVIVYDMKGLRDLRDPFVLRFADLCEAGLRLAAEQPGLWAALNDAAMPDDLAVLIYTSGTTGPPKGGDDQSPQCLLCGYPNSGCLSRHSRGRPSVVPAGMPCLRAFVRRLVAVGARGDGQLCRRPRHGA